jgi:hypothetical protein
VDDRIRWDEPFGSTASRAIPGETGGITLDPLPGLVQGLASVALGMTFIVGAPATMLLIWVLFDGHFRDFSRVDIILVGICGFIGILIILSSSVFGLVFGISAIVAARAQNRPASLGIAGVLLTGFDILLWLFIMILWAFAVGTRI